VEINPQEGEAAAAENHRIEVEINPQAEAATSALGEAIALAIVAVVATETEIAQADPIVRDSFRERGC
tara:strand:+ start:227 stop:430 length:204 start_codon:yes stop_codon:yes gene_type:complete